jgi:hypothetical protein
MADQTKRIIYQNDDGGVAVIIPPRDGDCDLTLEQIAAKDVPTGRPYKIIGVADIPADRAERMAWVVDEADLTDGIGK